MTILLAEDDKLHRRYIHDILSSNFQHLGAVVEADSGQSALDALETHNPEYAVLDLQMQGVSGIEVARRLWRRVPEAKVLFWSNFSDEPYVRGVTRIVPRQAVYGYVLKSSDEESLIFALRGVFIEDQCVIDRAVKGVQSRTLDRHEGLTDVEYETLFDVAIGLTDRAIARRRRISTRSVQSRLQGLYEKLSIADGDYTRLFNNRLFNPRARLVCLALMRGLLNRDAVRREASALESWLESRANHEANATDASASGSGIGGRLQPGSEP